MSRRRPRPRSTTMQNGVLELESQCRVPAARRPARLRIKRLGSSYGPLKHAGLESAHDEDEPCNRRMCCIVVLIIVTALGLVSSRIWQWNAGDANARVRSSVAGLASRLASRFATGSSPPMPPEAVRPPPAAPPPPALQQPPPPLSLSSVPPTPCPSPTSSSPAPLAAKCSPSPSRPPPLSTSPVPMRPPAPAAVPCASSFYGTSAAARQFIASEVNASVLASDRLPSFYVLGAAKAGTSSVIDWAYRLNEPSTCKFVQADGHVMGEVSAWTALAEPPAPPRISAVPHTCRSTHGQPSPSPPPPRSGLTIGGTADSTSPLGARAACRHRRRARPARPAWTRARAT